MLTFREQLGITIMLLKRASASPENDNRRAPVPILILGAAGRDFHIFNVCFRDDSNYDVVAFTAAQIPASKIGAILRR